MGNSSPNPLGRFLRTRRERLDPAAFGFDLARRRTPGLRREEVAQRARISTTWYTWLEQGRGGPPSPEALDRVADALLLSDAEREHLFHLALGSSAPLRRGAPCAVSPSIQRVLDALEPSPAFVKNVWWDIVAWNWPARVILADYEGLSPRDRNLLRRLFLDPAAREQRPQWSSNARFAVETFRFESRRLGASPTTDALVTELLNASMAFAELWSTHDVQGQGAGDKVIWHPEAGTLTLDYASFLVDEAPGLSLVVFTPATDEDLGRVTNLLRDAGR
ncbi:MAG: helix-turn-helix transcriptional regulator [Myxococcota bacterium]